MPALQNDKTQERRDTRERETPLRGPLTHLERIETGDNSAVFHLAALGRVGELALAVRPGARPPLELAADLQRQPLCVPDLRHVQSHVAAGGRGERIGRRGVRGKKGACACVRAFLMTVGAAARRDGQRTWETCGPEGFCPDFSDGLAYHLRLILKVWLVEVPQLLVTEALGSGLRNTSAGASRRLLAPQPDRRMRRTATGVYRSGRAMMKKGA